MSYASLLEKKRKVLHRKRVQLPENLVRDTNMAAVLLFCGNNMVDVTWRDMKKVYMFIIPRVVDSFTR